MLKITEQTPSRLVLEDRRRFAGGFALVFTLVSLLIFVMLAVLGADLLIVRQAPDRIASRLAGLGIYLLLLLGLTGFGALAAVSFLGGMTCILDKRDETVTIHSMNGFRREVATHSIYGIRGIHTQSSAEARAYALFLVLRTGDRIPLATVPMIDKPQMDSLVKDLRAFLHSL